MMSACSQVEAAGRWRSREKSAWANLTVSNNVASAAIIEQSSHCRCSDRKKWPHAQPFRVHSVVIGRGVQCLRKGRYSFVHANRKASLAFGPRRP